MLTIILTTCFFNNSSSFSKGNTIKVSKDKINGIYRVYNVFDKSIMDYYAICKNEYSYKFKVANKSLNYEVIPQKGVSEPKIIDLKYNIRSWTPMSSEFIFYGIKDDLSNSIKVKEFEKPNFLILYFRIRKDKISIAEFIVDDNDYETSLFGYKEFEEFNIIDDKTNKVIEICKSR